MAGEAAMAVLFDAGAKMGASNFALECEVSAIPTPATNIAPVSMAAKLQILIFFVLCMTAIFLLVIEGFFRDSDSSSNVSLERSGCA